MPGHAPENITDLLLKWSGGDATVLEQVAKALSKSREQRDQTVSELAADLKKLRLELLGETSAEPLSMADQNAEGQRRIITKTALESATWHKPKAQTRASSDTWKSALTYISNTAEQLYAIPNDQDETADKRWALSLRRDFSGWQIVCAR